MSGKGVISQNELMQKLVQAKKVMNKVDVGNFERGYVNEALLRSNPEDIKSTDVDVPSPKQKTFSHNPNKIMESKLPDVVKKAMIDHPISQISLSDSLDLDFVNKTKKLMEAEGVSSKPKQSVSKSSSSSNVDMKEIAIIIENTVRKVLDEKLNQLLTAQQTLSINENLVLKVGDSIFKGKITGVNKPK